MRYVARGISPGSGRRPGPDASKVCDNCGTTFTRLGGRRPLAGKAWETRRYCTLKCCRDHQATHGRTTGNFTRRVLERRLTVEEHYAFWTERFTAAEIREMASAIDFLSSEQVAA